jgi:hypothetical protein
VTIPQPKLLYEFNGDGTCAIAGGPTLTGGSYAAGLMSDAMSEGVAAYTAGTSGVSFAGAVSGGFWGKITAPFLSDYGPLRIGLSDAGADKAISLSVEAAGGGDVTVAVNDSEVTRTATPSVGWHYYSFSRAADGTTKLYQDGVQLGSDGSSTFLSGGVSDNLSASAGDGNGYGLMVDQKTWWEAELSAAQFLEAATPGGVPHADPWEVPAPPAGGAPCVRMSLGIGIGL